MPPQIGEILSEAVYDGKLKSNPKHPITHEIRACYFFDIANGKEKQPDGKSFMVTSIFEFYYFLKILINKFSE